MTKNPPLKDGPSSSEHLNTQVIPDCNKNAHEVFGTCSTPHFPGYFSLLVGNVHRQNPNPRREMSMLCEAQTGLEMGPRSRVVFASCSVWIRRMSREGWNTRVLTAGVEEQLLWPNHTFKTSVWKKSSLGSSTLGRRTCFQPEVSLMWHKIIGLRIFHYKNVITFYEREKRDLLTHFLWQKCSGNLYSPVMANHGILPVPWQKKPPRDISRVLRAPKKELMLRRHPGCSWGVDQKSRCRDLWSLCAQRALGRCWLQAVGVRGDWGWHHSISS